MTDLSWFTVAFLLASILFTGTFLALARKSEHPGVILVNSVCLVVQVLCLSLMIFVILTR